MTKICFITHSICACGGTERVFSLLANYFVECLHHEVQILSLFTTEGTPFFQLASGVDVIHCGLIPGQCNVPKYLAQYLPNNDITHVITLSCSGMQDMYTVLKMTKEGRKEGRKEGSVVCHFALRSTRMFFYRALAVFMAS